MNGLKSQSHWSAYNMTYFWILKNWFKTQITYISYVDFYTILAQWTKSKYTCYKPTAKRDNVSISMSEMTTAAAQGTHTVNTAAR